MGLLRSGERRQQKLGYGWGNSGGLLCGGLFLKVEIGQGQGLVLKLYKSRSLDLHSLYIHSFSIIDGLLL